ncbi:MAG: recombinase family protein [Oscillospiraceae bacterium]|jgi:DNA invertase Pin-like site-specific DNA recombinase|nr:recombinase family protein [Oscillospiraceae bacterium]
MPNVTVIPATITLQQGLNPNIAAKLRMAGYARVSSDSDEQQNSYEAQVDYYTTLIRSNPEWEFVKVYCDEGISGTNTRHRDGFNEMIQDALDGKLDGIITKSVSRFARNTLDSIEAVRKLKEKGIDVYFEKENIHSMDGKGELLLTIMSSLAQEEARNISENVTWGQRKRMADGKISMPYKRFLGYEKGEDGVPQIVESEAAVVREIYALFLEGKTIRQIARILMGQGVPTPSGGTAWSVSTLRSILTNEKYTGNAILQKVFTVDFLNKKTKINEGEVPQYFVENSHPGIILPETYELVQAEIARRTALGKQLTSTDSPFSCKILCGECGGFYGSKVWHSKSKYRKYIWQCNKKYRNAACEQVVNDKFTGCSLGDKLRCATPHVTEDELQRAFVAALNQLLGDKERYIQEFEAACAALTDIAALDTELATQKQECAIVAGLMQHAIADNAHAAQDQGEYQRNYEALAARFEEAKAKTNSLEAEKRERSAKVERIRWFISELRGREELLAAFDEHSWNVLAESITVFADRTMRVRFRDGTEVSVGDPQKV